jgi:hypothetical protein
MVPDEGVQRQLNPTRMVLPSPLRPMPRASRSDTATLTLQRHATYIAQACKKTTTRRSTFAHTHLRARESAEA